MKGSVAEATRVAPMASAQPAREPSKYGQTLANLREIVSFPAMPSALDFLDCFNVFALDGPGPWQ